MQFHFVEQQLTERRHNTYALVIFLPPRLDEIIMPLRERFDPLYSQLPSNLPVVFPFHTTLELDELVAKIGPVLSEQHRILIELSSIGDFYPKYPVIYWGVRKNDELCSLYYRLNSELDIPIPFKDFIAHVTVAREISDHRVVFVKDEIVPYLPDERFYASALDLVAPMAGNRWVSVRTFPLKTV